MPSAHQPAGTPRGGQFAPTGRSESDVDLDDIEPADQPLTIGEAFNATLETGQARSGGDNPDRPRVFTTNFGDATLTEVDWQNGGNQAVCYFGIDNPDTGELETFVADVPLHDYLETVDGDRQLKLTPHGPGYGTGEAL